MRLFILLLLLGLSLSLKAQTDRTRSFIKGDTMPNLTLTQFDFSTIQIDSAYAGKGMVLIFYKGIWSKPCLEQMHELENHRKDLAQKGFAIVAITTQPINTQKEMQEMERFKIPLMQDDNGAAIGRLGIGQGFMPIPTIFIIDRNHIIRYIYTNSNATERAKTEEVIEQVKKISSL